jgi:hypothetical protein
MESGLHMLKLDLFLLSLHVLQATRLLFRLPERPHMASIRAPIPPHSLLYFSPPEAIARLLSAWACMPSSIFPPKVTLACPNYCLWALVADAL